MKKDEGYVKKYEGYMKKYVGNIKIRTLPIYDRTGTWKNSELILLFRGGGGGRVGVVCNFQV